MSDLVESIETMVHGFSNEEHRQGVRKIAKEVEELEAQIATLKAENERLNKPDGYWDFGAPNFDTAVYLSPEEALDGADVGTISELHPYKELPSVFVAEVVTEWDDDGGATGWGVKTFATRAEAEQALKDGGE